MLEERISIVRLIRDRDDPRDARTVLVPSGSNAFYYVAKAIHMAKRMLEDPRVQRTLDEILRLFTAERSVPTRRVLFDNDRFRQQAVQEFSRQMVSHFPCVIINDFDTDSRNDVAFHIEPENGNYDVLWKQLIFLSGRVRKSTSYCDIDEHC